MLVPILSLEKWSDASRAAALEARRAKAQHELDKADHHDHKASKLGAGPERAIRTMAANSHRKAASAYQRGATAEADQHAAVARHIWREWRARYGKVLLTKQSPYGTKSGGPRVIPVRDQIGPLKSDNDKRKEMLRLSYGQPSNGASRNKPGNRNPLFMRGNPERVSKVVLHSGLIEKIGWTDEARRAAAEARRLKARMKDKGSYPHADLSATKLEEAYSQHLKRGSAVGSQMIAEGRGYEKPSETRGKSDELSQAVNDVSDVHNSYVDEMRRRERWGGSLKPIPKAHRQSFFGKQNIPGKFNADEEKHPALMLGRQLTPKAMRKDKDEHGYGSYPRGGSGKERYHVTHPLPDKASDGIASYDTPDGGWVKVNAEPDGSYTGDTGKYDFNRPNANTMRATLKSMRAKHAGWDRVRKVIGSTAYDYIDDFVHSGNKMFRHDSKAQRIRRALGAYYANKSADPFAFDKVWGPAAWRASAEARRRKAAYYQRQADNASQRAKSYRSAGHGGGLGTGGPVEHHEALAREYNTIAGHYSDAGRQYALGNKEMGDHYTRLAEQRRLGKPAFDFHKWSASAENWQDANEERQAQRQLEEQDRKTRMLAQRQARQNRYANYRNK